MNADGRGSGGREERWREERAAKAGDWRREARGGLRTEGLG